MYALEITAFTIHWKMSIVANVAVTGDAADLSLQQLSFFSIMEK